MPHIKLTSGRTFFAEPNQSILDAADAAGIILPYSCRSGRCCACKCKVTGHSLAVVDQAGLTAEERAEGWVLACAQTAVDDLTIEIQDLTALDLPRARILPAKIDTLELLSGKVMCVRLRLPSGNGFRFLSGQYIDVIGQHGIRRSYSLAKSYDGAELELHVRKVDGGSMSAYWFGEAKPNSLVRIHGPKGTFTLRHQPKTDVVFFATGTGMAPIKAMLEELSQQPEELRPRSVKLFWGGRHQNDFYFDPCSVYEALDYVPTLSRPDSSWKGAVGYVQNVFIATNPNLNSVQVYACGSESMIRGARSALEKAGLPTSAFFSDAFVASDS